MTRIKKILLLQQRGLNIEYHFRDSDSRLFVTKINENKFNLSTKNQVEAGKLIDEYMKGTTNDNAK